MGDDPQTSVIDGYHRKHVIPSVFLCDGSSFVTSGRGQPTLTIQALAFHAAEHIARFARRGEIWPWSGFGPDSVPRSAARPLIA